MANNTLQTPEQVFHYRDAICCGKCPAYNAALETCTRLKMAVDTEMVCDKHPAWKTLFHGKGGTQ